MATFHDSQIELAHGAGGKASRRLIENLIAPSLGIQSDSLTDAALLDLPHAGLAFTADSFVVKPLTFAGGSIGELAVNGTCNDLAVSGAQPIALLSTFILEAGLPTDILQAELYAMRQAADKAGVRILGGDTKVVEHGKADGLYITTSGIGLRQQGLELSSKKVQAGDQILLSGPIGDHGITILLARGELDLEADLCSDTRSVWPFIEPLLNLSGVRWMRDPTRGGVATSLNELAKDARASLRLIEHKIPIHDAVRGACEILGLDPLHIANEGQFLAVVAKEDAEKALDTLHGSGAKQAAIIGDVREGPSLVQTVTPYGATRVVDMLVGDPLPRIC